jgi:aminoglycoside phosphotransferase (APT) family kinase protein
VVAALDQMAEALTPAPVPVPDVGEWLGAQFAGWRTLAASPAVTTLTSSHVPTWTSWRAWKPSGPIMRPATPLLHADIRADNILLTRQRVMVVDWPWACRGAAFTDLVLFAPSVALQGGPEPAELIASSRSGGAASPHAVAALVCALAGYLTETLLRPPPPACQRSAPSRPRPPPSPATG